MTQPPQRERLQRKAKTGITYNTDQTWIPGQHSDNPRHNIVNSLNTQSFLNRIYAHADNALILALFAPKSEKKRKRWNALKPAMSPGADTTIQMDDEGVRDQIFRASQHCFLITHPAPDQDPVQTASDCATALMEYAIFQQSNRQLKTALIQYAHTHIYIISHHIFHNA